MKYMLSDKNAKCDMCHRKLTINKYFIDGRVRGGGWALMCSSCHKNYGVGIGVGKGQKYDSKTLECVAGSQFSSK